MSTKSGTINNTAEDALNPIFIETDETPEHASSGLAKALWRIDSSAYGDVECAVQAAFELLEVYICSGCGNQTYVPPEHCQECGAQGGFRRGSRK
jgi:rubrerythrin